MSDRTIERTGEPLARMRAEAEPIVTSSRGGTRLEITLPGQWSTVELGRDDPDGTATTVVLERIDECGEGADAQQRASGPFGKKSDLEQWMA